MAIKGSGKKSGASGRDKGEGRRSVDASALDTAWRKAMRGDMVALDTLLPLALKFDPKTPEGSSARRMVGRAHRARAQALEAEAVSAGEPLATSLRDEARRHLLRSVLAAHLDLQAVAEAEPLAAAIPAAAPVRDATAVVAETHCLLDPPPDAPADVLAVNTPPLALGVGGVTLSWTAPDDHGSKISRYDVSIVPPTVAAITVSGTTAKINSLPSNTAYAFTVKATNGDGVGPQSAPSNAVIATKAPPDPVTGVTAGVSSGMVVLNWIAPAKGAPFTQYWISVYDSVKLVRVAPRKTVIGDAITTLFTDLPKGSYVFGVRSFNDGGYADEVRSSVLAYTPPATAFTPALAPFASGLALPFDLGSSGLDIDKLRRRMAGVNDQANKWRFDYLKSLAVKAANDTLQYEQQILRLMQMTLSKVSTAQLLLSPVLQDVVKTVSGDIKQVATLATSGPVQGVVKAVGEAAATAVSLEGLLKFLTEQSPLDFWLGLFKGMLLDIAHVDFNLGYTNAFLQHYFTDDLLATLMKTIGDLERRVDLIVDEVAGPLRQAVAGITSGVSAELEAVLKSFGDPALLLAVAPGTGDLIPGGNPLGAVNSLLDKFTATLDEMLKLVRSTIDGTLSDLLNGEGLIIKLIKALVVYPILGVLVTGIVFGGVGAGIIGAVVAGAGVELLRLVASLITGPLLGQINDARKAALDALNELQKIFAQELALLDNPTAALALVSGHLAEVRELLPTAFLSDAASVLGDARRSVLNNANQLALAAERALGLEHCTAFDLISPDYQRQIAPAPQMPGGLDDSFLAGASMLRDFNALETARTQLLEGKELTLTHRFSLFKLLGGVGDPATATGTIAKTIKEFLSGGKLILRLSEESIIDASFPGLYRVLISDIRPIGVFGAATTALSSLPLTLPLTITHLGPARTRIKRLANPVAPPVVLDEVLKLAPDDLVKNLFSTAPAAAPGQTQQTTVKAIVDQAIADIVAALNIHNYGPAPCAVHQYSHPDAGWYYTAASIVSDDDIGRQSPSPPGHSDKPWHYDGPVFYAYPPETKNDGGSYDELVNLYQVPRKVDKDGNPDNSSHDIVEFFMGFDENELTGTSGGAAKHNFDVSAFTVVARVQKTQGPGSEPLYRFRKTAGPGHFYAPSAAAANNMELEDGVCYVHASAEALRPLATPSLANFAQVKAGLLNVLPDAISSLLNQAGGALLDRATISRTVAAILDALFVAGLPEGAPGAPVTKDSVKSALIALKIGDTLRSGFPSGAVGTVRKLPGLESLLRNAQAKALNDHAMRMAKWGDTQFKDDRDPQIRALGFVTLEQTFKPETALFNLLPNSTSLLTRLSDSGPKPDGLAPTTASATQQYRPFENRPFDGDLALGLELPPPLNSVVDLLFEITIRGCYDENLAAAVKASRSQRKSVRDQAGALLSSVSNQFFNLPGALPRLDYGTTAVRTITFSLRAQRDSLTQMTNAYAQSLLGNAETLDKKNGLDMGGLRFDAAKHLPLQSGDALTPLILTGKNGAADKSINEIILRFQRDKPGSLGTLAQIIALTPETFGMPTKLLDGLDNDGLQSLLGTDAGELVGLGIVVVPTQAGAQPVTPPDPKVVPNYDPKLKTKPPLPVPKVMEKITVSIDPLLQQLLPALAVAGQPSTLLTNALTMTASSAGPVSWAQLWQQAATQPDLPLTPYASGDKTSPPFIKLNFADALESGLVYDVILSISTRVPARLLTTSPATL